MNRYLAQTQRDPGSNPGNGIIFVMPGIKRLLYTPLNLFASFRLSCYRYVNSKVGACFYGRKGESMLGNKKAK